MINIKYLKHFFLFFVVFTASIVGVFHSELTRLYYTLTLYDDDKIVNNFSSISRMFTTVSVSEPADSSVFILNEVPLPKTYIYNGATNLVTDFISRTKTTSLMVTKDHQITYENYFLGTKQSDHRITWSTSKSIVSALFGIALHEGHIRDLNELVTDYVPELFNTGYENVRIKDVLQMSSGVGFNEDYLSFNSDINRFGRTFALGGSLDEFAGTLKNEREPGTFFHYVSINTHVLDMIIRAATGRTFIEYFRDKIWSRIQPEAPATFVVDNKGEPMILAGMNLRTRDFMRFGLLYMDDGKLNGEQIIPREWIALSITPDAPHLTAGSRETSDSTFGYGYHWWIPEDADGEYMAWGIYGQYIYINTKTNVVIVKTSANDKFADNNYESMIETVEFFRAISNSLYES